MGSDKRGTITVFLILILCSVVLFTVMVVEVTRVKLAQNQAQRALDITLHSALAGYDQFVKDEYGVFVVSPNQDLGLLSKQCLETTLDVGGEAKESHWTPYDFQVEEGSSLENRLTLKDTEVFRKQALEHVKYRVPIKMVGSTFEGLMELVNFPQTLSMMSLNCEISTEYEKVTKKTNKIALTLGLLQWDLMSSEYTNMGPFTDTVRNYEPPEPVTNAKGDYTYTPADMELDSILSTAAKVKDKSLAIKNKVETIERLVDEALRACEKIETLQDKIGELEENESVQENMERSGMASVAEQNGAVVAPTKALEGFKEGFDFNGILSEADKRVDYCEDIRSYLGSSSQPQFKNTPINIETDPLVKGIMDLTIDVGAANAANPDDVFKFLKVLVKFRDIIDAYKVSDEPYEGSLPFELGETSSKKQAKDRNDDGDNEISKMLPFSDAMSDVSEDMKSEQLEAAAAKVKSQKSGIEVLGLALRDKLYLSEYALITFSSRTSPMENHYFENTELEYIIGGYKNADFNCMDVNMKVLGARTVLNFVSIGNAKWANGAIEAGSLVLGAWGVPPNLSQIIMKFIVSAIEAMFQMGEMLNGEEIPLFISGDEDLTIVKAFKESGLEEQLGLNANAGSNKTTNKLDKKWSGMSPKTEVSKPSTNVTQFIKLDTDYEFYLRGLLWIDMLTREKTDLQRMQNLIKMGIEKNVDGKASSNIEDYPAYLKGSVNVSIKSIVPNFAGLNAKWDKHLPVSNRHQIHVESVRGY